MTTYFIFDDSNPTNGKMHEKGHGGIDTPYCFGNGNKSYSNKKRFSSNSKICANPIIFSKKLSLMSILKNTGLKFTKM